MANAVSWNGIVANSCNQNLFVQSSIYNHLFLYKLIQVVVFGECEKLKNIFERDESASLRTNHMLILNLAISDFLMGLYLVILGIVGAMFSGLYCMKSLEWLSSQTCVALGVLVVLSSETSTITMILLAATRLYAVFNVSYSECFLVMDKHITSCCYFFLKHISKTPSLQIFAYEHRSHQRIQHSYTFRIWFSQLNLTAWFIFLLACANLCLALRISN